MKFHLLRPLDRYVLREFTKIFVATALGFPFLVTIIDLTDNLDKYLNRNLPRADIALSYVYAMPENMFRVLPAAVLFAAVFTINSLARHSEITAAKASGISFYRLSIPIIVGSILAGALTLGLSEIAPLGNRHRNALLQENRYTTGTNRFNFAYAGEAGRVYRIGELNSETGVVNGIEIERKGPEHDPTYPTWLAVANSARWEPGRGWLLGKGTLHILKPSNEDLAISFESMRDRHFRETPTQLLAPPTAPEDMRYRELGTYLRVLQRSGSDVNELRVERALKIAVPVTCIIIALFGAPLASGGQRSGAAYGIGVSLAVTVAFLVFIQLTKAIGGKGLLDPDLAAWTPNILFGLGSVILLWRVRT